MKKSYIVPATTVVRVKFGKVLTQVSQMSVGSEVDNVKADSRRVSSWDDEDE